jgi:hypothetical protein
VLEKEMHKRWKKIIDHWVFGTFLSTFVMGLSLFLGINI